MHRLKKIIEIIKREQSPLDNGFIDLHRPTFVGEEGYYILNALQSGGVFSVGSYVTKC